MRDRARRLRREATTAERLLWSELRSWRGSGLRFRRQVPIEGFIVDFFCYAAQLAVEVDGPAHERSVASQRDAERQQFLVRRGIRVLRFTNDEVLANVDGVARRIERVLIERGDVVGRG
jgi:very-short-patch-repair endonuclease